MNDNYIQGFRIDWDLIPKNSYIRDIKALKTFNELIIDKPITFFVGENGSGKSTILEAIAEGYGLNKEGGSRNYSFSTYKEASDLKEAITIYKGYKKADYNYFFRAETFFNVSSKEEEYSKMGIRPSEEYHKESHGEGFLHLFNNLSKTKGIFLMDEPEAALSPQRQLTLFSLMYEASENGSQFIVITHSPILLAIPNADIYSFTDECISKCDYEETDSYKIINSFIKHKELMIKELIDE